MYVCIHGVDLYVRAFIKIVCMPGRKLLNMIYVPKAKEPISCVQRLHECAHECKHTLVLRRVFNYPNFPLHAKKKTMWYGLGKQKKACVAHSRICVAHSRICSTFKDLHSRICNIFKECVSHSRI
jgi:hypothetical protein